ncbi:23625_t:CDS:1, partial [Dentiscutata erythropus]
NDCNVEKFKQYIEEIDLRICQQEEAIIIIGETREGKSTILNYLIGIPLFGKRSAGRFKIYANDSPNGAKISAGSVSQTSLPSKHGEYWDCPGFGDTRSSIQDIVNAYSIYMLAKCVKKLKILVVVSENTIQEESKKKFLNLIKNVGEIFKNNDDLVQGLCLLVTKNKDLDSKAMTEILDELIKERENQTNFSSSQRTILEFLSSHDNQIAFFNAPNREGPISDDDKNSILETIRNTSYIKDPEPNIYTISESELFIRDLIKKFHIDIEKLILKFCLKIQNYLEELIDKHRGTIKELRKFLTELSDKLEIIFKDPHRFEDDLCRIVSITEHLQKNDIKEEISKKISQLNFIKLVKPKSLEFQGNTDSLCSLISKPIQDINTLTTLPSKKECKQGQVLTIKGIIIGTEDLISVSNYQRFSEINVYCLNSLFIDEDIIAPGVNLSFISPRWYVIGKRRINLQGLSGPSHKTSKAKNGKTDQRGAKIEVENINKEKEASKEMNGENGLPGLPGHNGGHFYAIGNYFFDLSSLTINVSGGNGGQGQDGGDGAKGLSGSDHVKTFVEERLEKVLASRLKLSGDSRQKIANLFNPTMLSIKGNSDSAATANLLKRTILLNDMYLETYEACDKGQKGGNGGQGGKGGYKGNTGSVMFANYDSLVEKPVVLKREGKDGINGKRGSPGSGGRNGHTYRGIYLSEKVLPGLRGYKELNTQSTESTNGISEPARAFGVAGSTALMVFNGVCETAVQGGTVISGRAIGGIVTAGASFAFTAQALASIVSSHFSSGWEKKPYIVPNVEFASEGKSIILSNNTNIIRPSDNSPINEKACERNSNYNQFYAKKKDQKFIQKLQYSGEEKEL